MADPCMEEPLVSKQQNRLRAALSKLSDVCNKNAKLTETVVAKSYGCQVNYKSRKLGPNNISALTRPPTPPQRTVSFFRKLKIAKRAPFVELSMSSPIILNYLQFRIY